MKKQNLARKQAILDYIDEYFNIRGVIPAVRDISAGTGIATTSVHRYLTAMRDSGELIYDGRRSINTPRMNMERGTASMPVLGYVKCGEGEEEQEEIVEYIRMPEALVGEGDFFALIAKGESMTGVGIYPGDYVIVRRQNTAKPGELVVALYEGLNNLKRLVESDEGFILRSCNPDKEQFPDILPGELTIQGVAVGVYHDFSNVP